MNKKTFKDNPAYQFISTAEEQPIEDNKAIPAEDETTDPTSGLSEEITKLPTSVKPPKGHKLNPAFIETKTRRLQLVLQPSLYNRVKKAAKKQKLSVNEFAHRALEAAVIKEETK